MKISGELFRERKGVNKVGGGNYRKASKQCTGEIRLKSGKIEKIQDIEGRMYLGAETKEKKKTRACRAM